MAGQARVMLKKGLGSVPITEPWVGLVPVTRGRPALPNGSEGVTVGLTVLDNDGTMSSAYESLVEDEVFRAGGSIVSSRFKQPV
ncbi:MAG: hypothetical protein ACKO6N_23190 [Myxococcota bacterium]